MIPRLLSLLVPLALMLSCTSALQVAQQRPVSALAEVAEAYTSSPETPNAGSIPKDVPISVDMLAEAMTSETPEPPTENPLPQVKTEKQPASSADDLSLGFAEFEGLAELESPQPETSQAMEDPNEAFRKMLEERLEEETETPPPSPTRSDTYTTGPASLTITLASGREVSLDEAQLISWEQAQQRSSRLAELPGWLLQGLEWLTDAPKTEPGRSQTLMPFFRFLKSNGHLADVDINDMTQREVITKLRVLVNELKKGNGPFNVHILSPETVAVSTPSRSPSDNREVNTTLSEAGPEGFWQPHYHTAARSVDTSPMPEDPNDKVLLQQMMKKVANQDEASMETPLRIALNPHQTVTVYEDILIEWEKGVAALQKGKKLSVDLPNWILQGIEWLTQTPPQEPTRSQIVMPIYRYMKAAGHLQDVNVDNMTPQQVVRKLRIWVDELKAGKGTFKVVTTTAPRTKKQPLKNQDATKPQSQENPQGSPTSPKQMKSYIKSLSVGEGYLGNGLSYHPAESLFTAPDSMLYLPTQQLEAHSLDHIPTRPSWKKAYLNKLTRVSLRVPYGLVSQESYMQYKVPDVTNALESAANELKSEYPWVPWGEISWDMGDPYRERRVSTQSQFFIRAGLNLPVIFVEIEGGAGRFSRAFLRPKDVLPPWKILDEQELTHLVTRRITTPKAKGAVTARVGVDLERITPDHLLPRLEFGNVAVGLDLSAYYLIGADFSYQVGLEIVDPNAADHLEGLFSRVPLISQNTKRQAAEAIVGHVESSMITYFWPPALQGFGFSGKAYIDLGQRLRIAARYHRERARGLRLKTNDWLFQGPVVNTQFLSFGIETQL